MSKDLKLMSPDEMKSECDLLDHFDSTVGLSQDEDARWSALEIELQSRLAAPKPH